MTSDRGIESARAHGPHDVRRDGRADRARRRSHRRRRDRERSRRQRRSLRRLRRGSDRRHSRQLVAASPRARRRPAGRRQLRSTTSTSKQFPVSGIDRIEVVEGGGSTLYGSGSIGGVINIITAPQPPRSTATLSTGSFGEQTYASQRRISRFKRTYAANDYSVENAPNRQNAQAGLTGCRPHATDIPSERWI